MMTSSRPRDVGDGFPSRRGHTSQLSISDPSHHVTEAIGTLYGADDDPSGPDGRPLSFMATPLGGEQIQPSQPHHHQPGAGSEDPRKGLVRSTSDQSAVTIDTDTSSNTNGSQSIKKTQTLPTRMPSQKSSSLDSPKSPKSPMSPLSPSPSLRDVQADEAGSQFPLTNIDNPSDIAQELSNLQALRRMSMDVSNNSDPDLLPFSGISLMSSVAPKGDDDEADPNRLLWVPARVHPELDTTAFKNFLENRVQSMKRRSGESMLSADGLERSDSGSLRRKKSMLSRQIDDAAAAAGDGYVDGAERLERKASQGASEVSLDELVKDPSKVVQKLTHDTQRQDTATVEKSMSDDMPILPAAPGMGLRRSTRTTYRKGGSLRGDRVPFHKRIAAKQAEREAEEAASAASSPHIDAPPGHSLSRVQSEPISENYSRPNRSVRRQQNFSKDSITSLSSDSTTAETDRSSMSPPPAPTQQHPLSLRTAAALAQRSQTPVPQIVETPAAEEPPPVEAPQISRPFPQRSSSQKAAQQMYPPPPDEPPARSSRRPPPSQPHHATAPSSLQKSSDQSGPGPDRTINDMANHPTLLPGSGGTRTDSLTFIPTMAASEERRPDRKSKDRDDIESTGSTRSSGWKWFKSDDREKRKKREKERERERGKEREREREKENEKDEEREKEEQQQQQQQQQSRRSKNKSFSDRAHDNARLDVLQSSIDNVVSKGRESLLLDRDSVDSKLQEERKKDGNRKSSESKKERDGFFGGLFGGSKKKTEKEASSKKKEQATLSPEPPARPMRPDIDFPWTRFTIIEERAIYRMAHIKLANPRRSLQSQVLLSNFMYSYLAKVQAMHPQLNVPLSPQQKRQEEERRRREAEQQQQLMMDQQMSQQSDGAYNFEYHRSGNQYGDAPVQQDGPVQYIDDAEIYQYEHGEPHDDGTNPSSGYHNGGSPHDGYGQGHQRQPSGGRGYYYGHGDGRYEDDDDEGDMW